MKGWGWGGGGGGGGGRYNKVEMVYVYEELLNVSIKRSGYMSLCMTLDSCMAV